jgi:hypothetical protein
MVAMKKDEKKTEVADMESKFMQALQKEMGDVEITEESVREYIAKMTPEQRQRLSAEGQDLKTELLTNSEHDQELQVFRNELNSKAEAAGLPVEKDGEHLGKKLLAHMRTTNEAPSHLLVLEAIASSPFLVKLAIAEARDGSPKADADDLSAIEAELRKLKVDGWRSEAEEAGRAPFVRRNLLLLHFVLYIEKIRVELKPATTHALSEISAKVPPAPPVTAASPLSQARTPARPHARTPARPQCLHAGLPHLGAGGSHRGHALPVLPAEPMGQSRALGDRGAGAAAQRAVGPQG